MFRILLLLLAVGLIIGGYFVLKSRAQSSQSAKITLFKETGSVSFKEESGEYVTVSTDQVDIPNKSTVKTSSDGLAHVVLPDNSMISLAENTEMQISYEDGGTKVLQYLGNAWFRIKKLAGKAEFSVETSSAVATVRGTIFGVEKGNTDTIYVTQSSVEVAQLKDQDGQKIKVNNVILPENKITSVGQVDTAPVIKDIPQEKLDSPWFKRNEIINKEFNSGDPRDFINKLKDDENIKSLNLELFGNPGIMGAESVDTMLPNFQSTDWIQNSREVCTWLNSPDFDKVFSQGVFLGQYTSIFQTAKKFCSDGVIDASESAEIGKMYSSINQ